VQCSKEICSKGSRETAKHKQSKAESIRRAAPKKTDGKSREGPPHADVPGPDPGMSARESWPQAPEVLASLVCLDGETTLVEKAET
jgi:hypothetical protein